MEYEGVIFDLDGTLLESSKGDLSWLHGAVEDVFSDRNVDGLDEGELEVLAGLGSKSDFVSKCNELGVDPESFWRSVEDARAKRKIDYVKNGGMSLCRGAEELLKYLNDKGVRCGVVSNSPDPSVDLIIRHFDIDQYLHFYRGVKGLKDFGRRKPEPDHLEMALAEIRRSPCVYVGDSSVDVETAERAGMDSIRVSKDSNLLELKHKL